MGAAMGADDIILMSPGRSSMKEMLKICQDYATDHNLQYSVDHNPAKSNNLKLYDENLPWVQHADHLGHVLSHVLSQLCNMEKNACATAVLLLGILLLTLWL